ncbi:beta-lactamase induction protein [Dokdonella sp.]|uniref:beta-lactamase induction protein n=1 Tax=Dokdonella sp. TaxID=2291710 RepID=UPI003528209F
MAKTLIAIVLVLVSMHALPDLARFRRFAWLRGWMGEDQGGSARTLLVPLLILVVISLIQAALHRHWFGLLELAFMVVVLYMSWGPRDLDMDIDAVLKAPDRAQRSDAAQMLARGVSEKPVSLSASSLVEASFAAALSRQFGVLFWFALLGPLGAAGYRLVQLMARSPSFREVVGERREVFERTALILDWAPAHLIAWTLALVSDFDATVRAWREYHLAHGQGYFTLDLGFLPAIARAGVDADVAAGDGGEESVGDPMAELADARVILRRVLYVWLAVIAVIVLGGWAN